MSYIVPPLSPLPPLLDASFFDAYNDHTVVTTTDIYAPPPASYWDALADTPPEKRNVDFLSVFIQYVLRDRSLYVDIKFDAPNHWNHWNGTIVPHTGILRSNIRVGPGTATIADEDRVWHDRGLQQKLGLNNDRGKNITYIIDRLVQLNHVIVYFSHSRGTYYHLKHGAWTDMSTMPPIQELLRATPQLHKQANSFRSKYKSREFKRIKGKDVHRDEWPDTIHNSVIYQNEYHREYYQRKKQTDPDYYNRNNQRRLDARDLEDAEHDGDLIESDRFKAFEQARGTKRKRTEALVSIDLTEPESLSSSGFSESSSSGFSEASSSSGWSELSAASGFDSSPVWRGETIQFFPMTDMALSM